MRLLMPNEIVTVNGGSELDTLIAEIHEMQQRIDRHDEIITGYGMFILAVLGFMFTVVMPRL